MNLQLLENLDRREEELIEFARDLIRTPSENPPGNEVEVAGRIVDRMKDLGIEEVRVLAKETERPNVLGSVIGSKNRPALLLNGHTDTRPVTEAERPNWIVDPYSAEIIDGKLYGRGSADMKGSLAAMIYAAAAIIDAGIDLGGTLHLGFFADEETGGKLGVNWLLSERELKADAALTGEPSGIDRSFQYLDIASRGVACFEILVRGTQMHSSLTDIKRGVNAGVKLCNVISALSEDLRLRHSPSTLYPQGPTINLGLVLEAGRTRGVVPGLSRSVNEIRLIPGMTQREVKEDVEESLRRLRKADAQLDVKINWTRFTPAAEISREEPVVKATLSAAKEILGFEPELSGFPAGCDGRQLINLGGVPSVSAFGPGLLTLAHSPNECIFIEDIVAASKIFALTAITYLGEEK